MKNKQNKTWLVFTHSLKRKTKNWQTLFFAVALPVLLTIMMYFVFGRQKMEPTDLSVFDVLFPGFAFLGSGLAIVGTTTYFAGEKKSGMLERLTTLPLERKHIFMGYLASESIFLGISTAAMFALGYGILGLSFASWTGLIVGILTTLLFGIQCIGIGILFASIAKTPEAANGFSQMYLYPVLYLSGALLPIDSPMVYVMPAFWGKQIFLQMSVFGDNFTTPLYNSSMIGLSAKTIGIPIWGGLIIFIALSVIFMVLGLLLFVKRTKF